MDKAPFIATHSEDAAKRATLPFVMAVNALASDTKAAVLQMAGSWLAKRSHFKFVHEGPSPPVIEPMQKLKKRRELIGGAVIVNAPTVNKEVGEARYVMIN